MGEVCLNVLGIWCCGFKQPLRIMTNMQPEAGLALVMPAYAVCLLVGEAIRDAQYDQVAPDELNLLKVPEVDKRSRSTNSGWSSAWERSARLKAGKHCPFCARCSPTETCHHN